MHDEPRPVATSPDTQYSLNIDQAATLYARAGHPRTLRTVQRYCASGHLDCVKAQTMLGDKYFVEPSSVARHIAQIEELVGLNTRAQGPGFSRQVATAVTRSHIPLKPAFWWGKRNGAPGRIRTYGLWIRNPTLYPAELRVHALHGLVQRAVRDCRVIAYLAERRK